MRYVTVALVLALSMIGTLGFVRGADAWLSGLDFVIAIVAIVSGVLGRGPVRRLRVSDFVLGATLLVASAYALFKGGAGWLSSWTAAIGLGFIILGASPHFRRHVERLSRPDRPSHA